MGMKDIDTTVFSFCTVTQETASSQTWMNVFKMFLVLMVCATQIYMTTSFFNKGSGGSRRTPNDINPFGNNSI